MRKLLCSALVLGAVQPGWAQDFAATIQGEGAATLSAQPEWVEFVVKFRVAGETFEEAAKKAEPLEENFREALDDSKLSTLNISFGAIQIHSLSAPAVDVSAVIRFPIRRVANPADRAAAFAKLCDRMNNLARQSNATITGPNLGVDNPEGFEQEAVQRAAENALYRADAIAAVMKSQIYAVQSVEILEVEWIRSTADPATAPDLDRLVCAARVAVVYSLAPR